MHTKESDEVTLIKQGLLHSGVATGLGPLQLLCLSSNDGSQAIGSTYVVLNFYTIVCACVF